MAFIDKNKDFIYTGTGWEYEGIQYPASIFQKWSDEDLSDVGVYRVVYEHFEVPEGKMLAGYTYSLRDTYAAAFPVFEDAVEEVPESVSRAQGKTALVLAGLWDAVVAYAESLEGTDKILADIALNDTTEWRRDSPFLDAAADYLDLTEKQKDELFLTAQTFKL